MSRWTAGELVTETPAFDGGRQVTAYVPAAAPEAVVFTGDVFRQQEFPLTVAWALTGS